jgi:hypothetical protein
VGGLGLLASGVPAEQSARLPDRSTRKYCSPGADAIPTIGRDGSVTQEPKKGDPKAKTPPSEAASQ